MSKWVVRSEVDLSKPDRVKTTTDFGYCLVGDKKAHSWEILCLNGNEKVDLSGYSVKGYFLRSDKKTVYVSGRTEGSYAICVLDEACYNVAGALKGSLKIENNTSGEIITIGVMYARVIKGNSDTIIDAADEIPSISELLSELDRMEAAIERANVVSETLENMTVSVTALPSGYSPIANYSDGHLSLQLPKGEKGDRSYAMTVIGSTLTIGEG